MNEVDLEARLISQEHRGFHVVKTFVERRKWEEGDARRDAARSALIWWALSPTTAGIAIGGVVAVGSLIALLWQNLLMVEQNSFLQQQIQETQRQFEAQRRTQVIAYLYEEAGGRPQANPRTRAEAFSELLSLERLRSKRTIGEQSERRDATATPAKAIVLNGIRLDRTRLDDTMGLDLSNVSLNGANFSGAELWRVQFPADDYKGLIFVGAKLYDVKFLAKTLTEVDFSHADVAATFVTPLCMQCKFEWTLFNAADLEQTKLIDPILKNAFAGVGTRPPKSFASTNDFAAYVRANGGFTGSWREFLEARRQQVGVER
jgi:hypothetical protein